MAPLWHVPMIFWQVLNIALVALLFYLLLRKKAPGFFSGRAAEVKEALDRAVREKESALERLAEAERRLAGLDQEVSAIRLDAAEAAAADSKLMQAETETLVARIRAEAGEEIERRVKAARAELLEYAADLIESMAREEIGKEMKADDEEKFAEDFLSKMEEAADGRAG